MDSYRNVDGALKCGRYKVECVAKLVAQNTKSSVEVTDEFDVEAVGAVDVAQEDDR